MRKDSFPLLAISRHSLNLLTVARAHVSAYMIFRDSFCINGGFAVAMVLNALEVDPKRTWKGNWRWYSGRLTKMED